MTGEPGPERRWLPVAEAARAFGVTEHAVRRRVRRGTLETRREVVGNKTRTLVAVPVASRGPEPAVEQTANMREQLARLEERLAASEAARERAEGEVAFLRAELQRRRWPGLRTWLRRVWAGEG